MLGRNIDFITGYNQIDKLPDDIHTCDLKELFPFATRPTRGFALCGENAAVDSSDTLSDDLIRHAYEFRTDQTHYIALLSRRGLFLLYRLEENKLPIRIDCRSIAPPDQINNDDMPERGLRVQSAQIQYSRDEELTSLTLFLEEHTVTIQIFPPTDPDAQETVITMPGPGRPGGKIRLNGFEDYRTTLWGLAGDNRQPPGVRVDFKGGSVIVPCEIPPEFAELSPALVNFRQYLALTSTPWKLRILACEPEAGKEAGTIRTRELDPVSLPNAITALCFAPLPDDGLMLMVACEDYYLRPYILDSNEQWQSQRKIRFPDYIQEILYLEESTDLGPTVAVVTNNGCLFIGKVLARHRQYHDCFLERLDRDWLARLRQTSAESEMNEYIRIWAATEQAFTSPQLIQDFELTEKNFPYLLHRLARTPRSGKIPGTEAIAALLQQTLEYGRANWNRGLEIFYPRLYELYADRNPELFNPNKWMADDPVSVLTRDFVARSSGYHTPLTLLQGEGPVLDCCLLETAEDSQPMLVRLGNHILSLFQLLNPPPCSEVQSRHINHPEEVRFTRVAALKENLFVGTINHGLLSVDLEEGSFSLVEIPELKFCSVDALRVHLDQLIVTAHSPQGESLILKLAWSRGWDKPPTIHNLCDDDRQDAEKSIHSTIPSLCLSHGEQNHEPLIWCLQTGRWNVLDVGKQCTEIVSLKRSLTSIVTIPDPSTTVDPENKNPPASLLLIGGIHGDIWCFSASGHLRWYYQTNSRIVEIIAGPGKEQLTVVTLDGKILTLNTQGKYEQHLILDRRISSCAKDFIDLDTVPYLLVGAVDGALLLLRHCNATEVPDINLPHDFVAASRKLLTPEFIRQYPQRSATQLDHLCGSNSPDCDYHRLASLLDSLLSSDVKKFAQIEFLRLFMRSQGHKLLGHGDASMVGQEECVALLQKRFHDFPVIARIELLSQLCHAEEDTCVLEGQKVPKVPEWIYPRMPQASSSAQKLRLELLYFREFLQIIVCRYDQWHSRDKAEKDNPWHPALQKVLTLFFTFYQDSQKNIFPRWFERMFVAVMARGIGLRRYAVISTADKLFMLLGSTNYGRAKKLFQRYGRWFLPPNGLELWEALDRFIAGESNFREFLTLYRKNLPDLPENEKRLRLYIRLILPRPSQKQSRIESGKWEEFYHQLYTFCDQPPFIKEVLKKIQESMRELNKEHVPSQRYTLLIRLHDSLQAAIRESEPKGHWQILGNRIIAAWLIWLDREKKVLAPENPAERIDVLVPQSVKMLPGGTDLRIRIINTGVKSLVEQISITCSCPLIQDEQKHTESLDGLEVNASKDFILSLREPDKKQGTYLIEWQIQVGGQFSIFGSREFEVVNLLTKEAAQREKMLSLTRSLMRGHHADGDWRVKRLFVFLRTDIKVMTEEEIIPYLTRIHEEVSGSRQGIRFFHPEGWNRGSDVDDIACIPYHAEKWLEQIKRSSATLAFGEREIFIFKEGMDINVHQNINLMRNQDRTALLIPDLSFEDLEKSGGGLDMAREGLLQDFLMNCFMGRGLNTILLGLWACASAQKGGQTTAFSGLTVLTSAAILNELPKDHPLTSLALVLDEDDLRYLEFINIISMDNGFAVRYPVVGQWICELFSADKTAAFFHDALFEKQSPPLTVLPLSFWRTLLFYTREWKLPLETVQLLLFENHNDFLGFMARIEDFGAIADGKEQAMRLFWDWLGHQKGIFIPNTTQLRKGSILESRIYLSIFNQKTIGSSERSESWRLLGKAGHKVDSIDIRQLLNETDDNFQSSNTMIIGFEQSRKKHFSGKDHLVWITKDELPQLLASPEPKKNLQTIISDQRASLKDRILKRYKDSQATPIDMFYGREEEIRQIVKRIVQVSILVTGSRRIGKSSLLMYLQNGDQGFKNRSCHFIDMQGVSDYRSTLTTMAEALWLPVPDTNSEVEAVDALQKLIMGFSSSHGMTPVLLLDEIDQFFWYDFQNGEKVFRVFRSLDQQKKIRFVVASYLDTAENIRKKEKDLKTLVEMSNNHRACVFNFFEVVRLGAISLENARNLVSKPMAQAGVRVSDAVADYLVRQAFCLPAAIQFSCILAADQLEKESMDELTHEMVGACKDQVMKFLKKDIIGALGEKETLALLGLLLTGKGKATAVGIERLLHDLHIVLLAPEIEKILLPKTQTVILDWDGMVFTLRDGIYAELIHSSMPNDEDIKMYMENQARAVGLLQTRDRLSRVRKYRP